MLISLSASPILYHITGIGNASNILKNNEFKLSPAIGTDADIAVNKGHLFFMSMSRSRHGRFNKMYSGFAHFIAGFAGFLNCCNNT